MQPLAPLALLPMLALLPNAGSVDLDLSDITVPLAGAAGGQRQWNGMPMKRASAKLSDVELKCPDQVALCLKDPDCAKQLDESFSGKPFGTPRAPQRSGSADRLQRREV